jgi:Carboxypeptidase controlling helical cell shape catalytic
VNIHEQACGDGGFAGGPKAPWRSCPGWMGVPMARRVLRALLVWLVVAGGSAMAQERVHKVFFEGTDHELHVYRIHGKAPGPTLMLIGGIQGDEPGGYLAVDHYADLSLARGNLIVVPRANFRSILVNRRQINRDMNRTFADDRGQSYEAEVVDILKALIAESDCLLNVHDGSGFYSPRWEGPDRNPHRYGQSIIADADTFTVPESGRVIELGALAAAVCRDINRHIDDSRQHFHFNNHQTDAVSSLHKEQRKSATYYALHACHIPAFGVESSKSLPLEVKVRQHHLAINAFMARLGVVPQTPGLNLKPPRLRYLVVSINGGQPIVVRNGQTLSMAPGADVVVSHIEANYERGLSADILGVGTVNDLRRPVTIHGSTRIAVRKDYYPCGSVSIVTDSDLAPRSPASVAAAPVLPQGLCLLKLRINGQERIFQKGDHVRMVKGDRFEIVDLITGLADPGELVVNLKGFVGDRRNNTGEDRGYVIRTDRDLWKRYSLHKKGLHYQVLVTEKKQLVGKLFIDLQTPVLKYVVLGIGEAPGLCLAPGETRAVAPGQGARLVDIQTNIQDNAGVRAFVRGPGAARYPVGIEDNLDAMLSAGAARGTGNVRIDVLRRKMLLGSVYLTIDSEGGS